MSDTKIARIVADEIKARPDQVNAALELLDGGVLMEQLMKHSPGDVIQVKVRRDGEVIDIPVTLKARDGSS